jgi:hypothetical protein
MLPFIEEFKLNVQLSNLKKRGKEITQKVVQRDRKYES